MKFTKNINEGSDEKFTTYETEKNGMKIEISKTETWNYNWNGRRDDLEVSDWVVYVDGKKLKEEFSKITEAKKFVKESTHFIMRDNRPIF